ncbi:uncharacterized protein LOC113215325 [Frankliniella occidentalis]|uniref:Uncharacterized protein LOC113215325 n=1 Tax=Frankliniella occidentalis TaxID=133901 RepID=A0A6J1TAY0_FRAOC|nr:uncharacterized protein LOC113215325 [Frankliniella occidentalis]XP_052125308.1 uncharacterized protein LOC113215325 [Frankliniella occidentalis]XP_052125309.1 uncharacterized protein LOC113215325 [Frankliniella occidentalis]
MDSADSTGGMIGLAALAVIVLCAIIYYCCCYRCGSNRDRVLDDVIENSSINKVPKYHRFDDDIESGFRVPTLNLHGYHKKEALKEVDKFIKRNEKNDVDYVRIIPGRGVHSKGGVPVLKPAVEARLGEKGLWYWCSENNPGLIHVDLS